MCIRDSSRLAYLGSTKLIALKSLGKEEREELIESGKAEELSVRELKEKIKELTDKNEQLRFEFTSVTDSDKDKDSKINSLQAQLDDTGNAMRRTAEENEKLNITYYYDVYDPKLWYLEVFSSMASKEQGVRYLRENYGFDFVTAFGDNTNDLPMFKAADKRVAVKNACKEMLEGCDEVTGTNEEDGVAEYLLKTFERN